MEPTDITSQILREMRDELRGVRGEQAGTREEIKAMQAGMRDEIKTMTAVMNQRFEVIETTLRDPASQMVLLARGVKVALESRGNVDTRLTEIEARLGKLEKREPH